MTIKNAIMISLCTQRCYGRHNVSRKSIFTSCLSILLHGVISLPEETSYDKRKSSFKIRMNAFDNYVKKGFSRIRSRIVRHRTMSGHKNSP